MKAIKYILLSCLGFILIGIISRQVYPIPGGNMMLVIGVLLLILMSFVYAIMTLAKKQHRIEAAMLFTSIPILIGVMFKLMYWPGSATMIIFGSCILLLVSITIFIYSLLKKNKVRESILFFAIGYASVAYYYKMYFWPGYKEFAIATLITNGAVVVFIFIKMNQKIRTSTVVLVIIIGLISLSLSTKESSLYQRGNIKIGQSELNHPENYYEYAWLLYQEGSYLRAKTNLEYAIDQTQNPTNKHYDSPYFKKLKEEYIKIFNQAIEQIQNKNWDVKTTPRLAP